MISVRSDSPGSVHHWFRASSNSISIPSSLPAIHSWAFTQVSVQTSAAFGGTTCHVDFIIQPPGATFAAVVEEWRAKANGKQVIDMGYHMAVTDLKQGGTLEELASLP